ncbi:MAG: hypothetical protein ACOCQC_03655 [Halanaerobiaceae bacterium]
MKTKILLAAVVFVMICLFALPAVAGEAAGLGHDFSTREGAEALTGNPAFVNPTGEFFVLESNIDLGVRNNALDSGNLQEYLDDETKGQILQSVEEYGLTVAGEGTQELRLILGNVGLYSGLREQTSASIAPDLVELLLEGNELDKVYTLEGTRGDLAVYSDAGINISLSLDFLARALQMEQFKLGLTGHHLFGGFGYLEGVGELEFTSDGEIRGYEDGYLDMEYAELASGEAFDIGIQARPDEKLVLGAAAMNIGSLEAEKAYTRRYQYDEEEGTFKDSGEESLSELIYNLPREYKMGFTYSPFSRVDLYGDYVRKQLNKADDENIYAAGVEVRPVEVLPLRAGANYSTFREDIAFSAGLGMYLGPLQTDIGVSDLKFFSDSAKSVRVGISSRLEF